MAIKRGGPGGPRVPPNPRKDQQPSGVAPRTAPQRGDVQKTDSQPPQGASELQARGAFDADGFDDDALPRSTPGDRAEDVFRSEQRSSAVRNTERLLETTYERLAQDYASVHADARALVAELAAQGFSASALDDAGPTLRQHRAKIAKVRARLSTIRRRLREMALPAGTVLDLQLEQRLGEQLKNVAALERGAERALAALQLATTFRPRAGDGSGAAVVRVNVEGASQRDALGSEIARAAPDATATDTMLRLLTGEAPAADAAPDEPRQGPRDVRALFAFAAAQLGT